MKKIVIVLLFILIALIFFRNKNQSNDQVKKPLHEVNDVISAPLVIQETSKEQIKIKHHQEKQTQIKPSITNPDFLSLDQNQSLMVSSFIIVDNDAIGFGDILVAEVEDILELDRKNLQPILPKPRSWPQGIIPYVIDPEVEQEHLIKNVMHFFHQHTPIRFVERIDQEDYVIFLRGSEHCYAHLGRIGGQQKVVLSENCGEAEIAHELMHTLGFIHEQNREDRDQFVEIFWNNIDENYHEQFKIIPSQFQMEARHPLMTFNFDTIMIYHPFAFAIEPDRAAMLKKDGQQWPVIQSLLGPRDIERINLIYK